LIGIRKDSTQGTPSTPQRVPAWLSSGGFSADSTKDDAIRHAWTVCEGAVTPAPLGATALFESGLVRVWGVIAWGRRRSSSIQSESGFGRSNQIGSTAGSVPTLTQIGRTCHPGCVWKLAEHPVHAQPEEQQVLGLRITSIAGRQMPLLIAERKHVDE